MGHNAWTNYVVGTRWNIIFDIKPEQGSRFLMDGLPGVIVSDDDFGVNSAGIMVTETTITQFEGWDPKGKPEFVRARKAAAVQPFDRRLRADHARRQQRRLRQRLADRRQQDRRDRAPRARTQEPRSCNGPRTAAFSAPIFPITDKLTKEETKFDPTKKDSSPNARKVAVGAARRASTRERSTSSWARRSRPTIST